MSVTKIITVMFCILSLIVGFVLGGLVDNFRYETVVAEKDALRKDLLYNIGLLTVTQDALISRGRALEEVIYDNMKYFTIIEAYKKRDNFDPNDLPE